MSLYGTVTARSSPANRGRTTWGLRGKQNFNKLQFHIRRALEIPLLAQHHLGKLELFFRNRLSEMRGRGGFILAAQLEPGPLGEGPAPPAKHPHRPPLAFSSPAALLGEHVDLFTITRGACSICQRNRSLRLVEKYRNILRLFRKSQGEKREGEILLKISYSGAYTPTRAFDRGPEFTCLWPDSFTSPLREAGPGTAQLCTVTGTDGTTPRLAF